MVEKYLSLLFVKWLKAAVNVIEKAGLTKEDVDFLIPHQANIRIMEASRQRLDLPEEKMAKTINKYGNTSSASIPIAMVEELEAGKIKDDDVIVMVGFGGGLLGVPFVCVGGNLNRLNSSYSNSRIGKGDV